MRNSAGSSEDKDIDSVDLAPFSSCHITPILTVPAADKDKSGDGDCRAFTC